MQGVQEKVVDSGVLERGGGLLPVPALYAFRGMAPRAAELRLDRALGKAVGALEAFIGLGRRGGGGGKVACSQECAGLSGQSPGFLQAGGRCVAGEIRKGFYLPNRVVPAGVADIRAEQPDAPDAGLPAEVGHCLCGQAEQERRLGCRVIWVARDRRGRE